MNKYFKSLISIFLTVIITIILHYSGALLGFEQFLRNSIFSGSSKLYDISVVIAGNTEKFKSEQELLEAYKKIKLKEVDFIDRESKYLELERDNKSLRNQLNFLEKQTFETVGADVIGKQIDPISRTITINRGQQDGVLVGNPVITNGGVLVGFISVVNSNDSIARLLTDNESRVASMLLNQDRSIGIIEGGFGLTIRMTFIPQQEIVEIGNIIVTSGLEKNVPRGLVIGEVASVEKEPFEPFQRALITTPVIFDKLSVVSVITNITNSDIKINN